MMTSLATRGQTAQTHCRQGTSFPGSRPGHSIRSRQEPANQGTRVISVTSGKGGVGKSNVAANLALALTKSGNRVLIIDADVGLANIDVLLGLTPRHNLNDVLRGEKHLSEIIMDGPGGIRIIPAGSGIQQYTRLGIEERLCLLNELDQLEEEYDYLIIDTDAGISENVTYFTVAAQEILLVVTAEPTSITDAYALVKLLASRYGERHFKVLVNMANDADEALDVYARLCTVTQRFLEISLDYLGFVLRDHLLPEAVKRQRAVMELYPKAESSVCFAKLAKRIEDNPAERRIKGSLQFFFRKSLALAEGMERI